MSVSATQSLEELNDLLKEKIKDQEDQIQILVTEIARLNALPSKDGELLLKATERVKQLEDLLEVSEV
jgi:hypothetical protein